MTSLPPDIALYHMDAKVFQRSKGRSAVAAAAYRSASKLVDERTGQEFDYRRKHKYDAFIFTPADAPSWAQDRQDLWSRAEAAERRKDAVLAREVETSIPRDVPESEWRAFAEKICQPYLDAGAVCDVAVHCPRAADGDAQPHLHIMMTIRAFDPSTDTGFSKKRNDSLAAIFESGGRRGGKKGEALEKERARIADIGNRFLSAAGSDRRMTHQRWKDLGIDREPEPTMGESRLHAVNGRKKHDRRTAHVSALRNARKAEFELNAVEEEIMATSPKFQIAKGIRPRHRQDFKTKLLSDRFPDADLSDLSHKLYQVDTRSPSRTLVRMRDHGWAEIEGRRIKTYGHQGQAGVLAQRIVDAGYADDIENLAETASFQKRGSGLRQRRKSEPETLPAQPLSAVEARAEWWLSQGFTQVSPQPDGVWISIGSCRLQDLGDELRVHGWPTDDAMRAMVLRAVEEWSGEMEVFGSREFKDMAWLEAQRQGIKLFDADTGKEYKPSASVAQQWHDSAEKNRRDQDELEQLHAAKKLSELLKSAAAGDAESAARLQNHDPDLHDFLSYHLDEDQRREFAQESNEKVIPALQGFREYGKRAREDQEQKAEEQRTPDLAERLEMEEAAREAEVRKERRLAPQ